MRRHGATTPRRLEGGILGGDRPKAAPKGPWPLGMRNEVNADLTDIESRDEERLKVTRKRR